MNPCRNYLYRKKEWRRITIQYENHFMLGSTFWDGCFCGFFLLDVLLSSLLTCERSSSFGGDFGIGLNFGTTVLSTTLWTLCGDAGFIMSSIFICSFSKIRCILCFPNQSKERLFFVFYQINSSYTLNIIDLFIIDNFMFSCFIRNF